MPPREGLSKEQSMVARLDGRVAVVTGASRGVGRAVAARLAGHGASVALGARSVDDLEAVEREIRASGGTARAIPLDVSQLDSVEAFARDVEQVLGSPSILVNNAAMVGPIGLLQHGDPLEWARTIEINVLGPYFVTRRFLPAMLERGWGRIVNVSSAAALIPPAPLISGYATSKVALNHFTRCLAAELGGRGITVNAIHPGEVMTEMQAHIRRQAALAGPAGEPLLDITTRLYQQGGDPPEKAADLVLRLVSEEAAAISGHFYFIEDGLLSPMPTWSDPPPLPH
jgi:NAD(P)-dependent dehydrogenase (short-subunit alcohol dehydrogenase family)